MKRLLELAKHSRGKKLFLQTYITMTLVRLGLLMLPFSRLNDLVGKSKQLKFLNFASQEVNVNRIVQAVYRSSRHQPGNPMCLARALTTSVLMSIYDFPHEISIGVAKGENGKLKAHAWVMSQDNVIVGNLPDLSSYVPMSAKGEGMIA